MSAGNTFENELAKFIFQNVAIAGIADPAASGNLTQYWIALHTADPGEAGAQNTSEASYGSYARVAVARTSGGFTVVNNVVSNAAAVTFPAATSGSQTITHFSIGTASSGTGKILVSGALTASLAVTTSIQPSFAAGQLTANFD